MLCIDETGALEGTDPKLLSLVAEEIVKPKTAVVVTVKELIFHCGKAINRSGLWKEESRIGKKELPSVGMIMRDLAGAPAESVAAVDERYEHDVKHDLY